MSTQNPSDDFTDEDLDAAKAVGGTPAAAKKRRLAEDAKCRDKEMRQAAKREMYLFKQCKTDEPEYEQLRAARLQREADGEQPKGLVWGTEKRGAGMNFFDRK